MMGEFMLLATGDQSENLGEYLNTFLLKTQPNLAVVSYKELIEERVSIRYKSAEQKIREIV